MGPLRLPRRPLVLSLRSSGGPQCRALLCRTMSLRQIAMAIGLGLGAITASGAQTERPLTAPREFAVDQWTTDNGLPQNTVNAIAQTPDGYVWLGTFGGLARFDGSRFEVVPRVDATGRHTDRILALAVAPDRALWIGTENGLLRYRDGKFVSFGSANGLPADQVNALLFDRSGVLWIGMAHDGAVRYTGGRFVPVMRADGSRVGDVVSFVEDSAGAVWINVPDRVLRFADGRLRAGDRARGDNALLDDQRGALWFRIDDGVIRIADGRLTTYRGVGGQQMVDQDRPGRYWVGTYLAGLLDFGPGDPGRPKSYPLPNGSTNYGVKALYAGRDGNVWVGTNRSGLLRLKRKLFTTYRAVNGLSHDVITDVVETRDRSLWVGTNCGGVDVIDPSRRTVRKYRLSAPRVPGAGACVFALAQDSTGAVWVGTYGGGLTRIRNGTVEPFGIMRGLRDSVILCLHADPDGTLWVGTNGGGVAVVKAGRVLRSYTAADGLTGNSVRTLVRTHDGALWIGTQTGLNRLDRDGRLTTYTAGDGLSSESIRAIYEDTDGTLWVGTYGGGLNRMRNGRFASITRADGLADDVVSSIVDDGNGNLWMTGNRGVYRVAKEQLNARADGRLQRVQSVLYGTADGLVNPETNGGFQPAAWKDHDGRLWFPTIEGLASVDPTAAVDIPSPPPVTIDAVVVDGESRKATGPLEVGPGRPNIEFRYNAVSLSAPYNVTFRYRLDHLDQTWVESGTGRVAAYARVPPGRYRFLVTAANRDGRWNPVPAVVDLTVIAPLYRRGWFIAAVLSLFLLALWLAHTATLHTRTEAIREERSRLAREIHDSLLQGFGGIALELDAAAARLALPPAQQPLLDRVLTLIDGTLTQARKAVWDIRPVEITSREFVQECEAAGERILSSTAVSFRVVRRGRPRRLPNLYARECLRIVEEALTNVRKHAAAHTVVVLLHYSWFRFNFAVRDDGEGFDVEADGKPRGHWGILGMRERASRFGARLTLHSRPGSGTTISVDGPFWPGFWFVPSERPRN